MDDPGWRGTWRFGHPLPNIAERRFAALRAPSQLHARRGATIGGAGLAVGFSLTIALLAVLHGRVRIGDAGSGATLLLGLTLVLALGQAYRFHRGERFDPTDPRSTAAAFWAASALPQVLGLAFMVAAGLVTLFTGWWPPVVIGGALAFIGMCLGAPTRTRIERAEAAYRSCGYEAPLLDQLVAPTAPPAHA